jgi:hypothetical protein
MVLAVAIAFLLGPVGTALGEAVDHGDVGAGMFGPLLIVCGLLLREVGKQAEALAFGVKQRPWLSGRMTRWQRLILPYSTASVLTYGLSCGFSGGVYLLSAMPGPTLANFVALGFVAIGGFLLGFGITRVLVGILIIHFSGLWAARRRAWLIGGAVVVLGSLAHAIYTVERTAAIVGSF